MKSPDDETPLTSLVGKRLKTILKATLKSLGIGITTYGTLEHLRQVERTHASAGQHLKLLLALPPEKVARVLQLIDKSRAQIRQDLFVLAELDFKENGFFVEFGATSGVNESNTFLLEKEFGWNGILAEPARVWHARLRASRSAHIETKCVWRDSNSTLMFNEARTPTLSTINSFSSSDGNSKGRRHGKMYEVETISLRDLLRKFNAPRHIDYMSLDTEGSEFDILENFDFTEYQFSVITCEHNYTPRREKVFSLLTRHGYVRKFEHLSDIDDWYIGPNIAALQRDHERKPDTV